MTPQQIVVAQKTIRNNAILARNREAKRLQILQQQQQQQAAANAAAGQAVINQHPLVSKIILKDKYLNKQHWNIRIQNCPDTKRNSSK